VLHKKHHADEVFIMKACHLQEVSGFNIDRTQANETVLEGFINQPCEGPNGLKYFTRCCRYLFAYGLLVIGEHQSPRLTQIHEKLGKHFLMRKAHKCDAFYLQWLLCDVKGLTVNLSVLDLFNEFAREFQKKTLFKPFVKAMRESHMSIYEVVLISSKKIRYRDINTGDVFSVYNALTERPEEGALGMTRIVLLNGQYYQALSPVWFSRDSLPALQDAIRVAQSHYQHGCSAQAYAKMMRTAGPYWLSKLTHLHEDFAFGPNWFEDFIQGDA
jgi:hypothetical protein